MTTTTTKKTTTKTTVIWEQIIADDDGNECATIYGHFSAAQPLGDYELQVTNKTAYAEIADDVKEAYQTFISDFQTAVADLTATTTETTTTE